MILSDDAQPSHFAYFLNEKSTLLVVTLQGALGGMESLKSLDQCQTEILAKSATQVILNLEGLMRADYKGIAALTKMQMAIRQKPAKLRVCLPKDELADLMKERGALRNEEVAKRLADALKTLSQK